MASYIKKLGSWYEIFRSQLRILVEDHLLHLLILRCNLKTKNMRNTNTFTQHFSPNLNINTACCHNVATLNEPPILLHADFNKTTIFLPQVISTSSELEVR